MPIQKGPANLGTGTIDAAELASGSVTTAKLATTLTVTHALGSASTPSITFTGDTNTGIFSPTADTIAFAEGGAEIARFDSSGNLGIDTTSPAYRLHVRRAGGVASLGINLDNTVGFTRDVQYYSVADSTSDTTGHAFYVRNGSATNNLALRINNTGTLTLQGGSTSASGVGITFPATQSASSDANTLDDYEEGTWTPIFGSQSGSATYSAQTGTYTKIGRVVTVTFYVRINVSSSLVSDGNINGLPFAGANSTYAGGALAAWEGGSFAAYSNMLVLVASGVTVMQLRATPTANQAPATIFSGSTLANSTFLAGTITYYAA
jgi:hypothetical protein